MIAGLLGLEHFAPPNKSLLLSLRTLTEAR